jgi:hypothetical protein
MLIGLCSASVLLSAAVCRSLRRSARAFELHTGGGPPRKPDTDKIKMRGGGGCCGWTTIVVPGAAVPAAYRSGKVVPMPFVSTAFLLPTLTGAVPGKALEGPPPSAVPASLPQPLSAQALKVRARVVGPVRRALRLQAGVVALWVVVAVVVCESLVRASWGVDDLTAQPLTLEQCLVTAVGILLVVGYGLAFPNIIFVRSQVGGPVVPVCLCCTCVRRSYVLGRILACMRLSAMCVYVCVCVCM